MKKLYALSCLNLAIALVAIVLAAYATKLLVIESSSQDVPAKVGQGAASGDVEKLNELILENKKGIQTLSERVPNAKEHEIQELKDDLKRITELLDSRLNCPQLNVIEENTNEIANLRHELDVALRLFRNIDSEIELLKKNDLKSRSTFIPVSRQESRMLNIGIGNLTCGVADIKEYANGSKIKLKLVNPLSVTINDLSFSVEYGSLSDEVIDSETTQKKKVNLVVEIPPANARSVDMVLEKVKPSDLGYLLIQEANIGSYSFFK